MAATTIRLADPPFRLRFGRGGGFISVPWSWRPCGWPQKSQLAKHRPGGTAAVPPWVRRKMARTIPWIPSGAGRREPERLSTVVRNEEKPCELGGCEGHSLKLIFHPLPRGRPSASTVIKLRPLIDFFHPPDALPAPKLSFQGQPWETWSSSFSGSREVFQTLRGRCERPFRSRRSAPPPKSYGRLERSRGLAGQG